MDQKKKARHEMASPGLLCSAVAYCQKYLLVIPLFIFIITVCKQENDPFWEPYDAEVYIGSVQVYLQSLAYLVGTA